MIAGKEGEIVFLGGGGHARVLAEMIKVSGQYEIAGVVDPRFEKGTKIDGLEILGGDDELPQLYENGFRNLCIAVGSVRDNSKRKDLYEKAMELGFVVPALIHHKSTISDDVEISGGVQIMAGAILQPGASIGENTIINTGSIVEHDCILGSHIHVCPGAVVSGEVTVGDEAFIGAGATIVHGVRIGKGALIGAGAVVVSDVPENTKVVGVPAK